MITQSGGKVVFGRGGNKTHFKKIIIGKDTFILLK